MPNFSTHVNITEQFLVHTDISEEQKNSFRAGGIFTDVLLEDLTRDVTHYYSDNSFLDQNFIKSFLEKENLYNKDGSIRFFILGYLFHLFIDNSFIDKKPINNIFINEHVWKLSKSINEVLDMDKNSKIIYKLENIGRDEKSITKSELPIIFEDIAEEKINSEFKRQVKNISRQTIENYRKLLPQIKKSPQIDIKREKHKENIQKSIDDFIDYILKEEINILNKTLSNQKLQCLLKEDLYILSKNTDFINDNKNYELFEKLPITDDGFGDYSEFQSALFNMLNKQELRENLIKIINSGFNISTLRLYDLSYIVNSEELTDKVNFLKSDFGFLLEKRHLLSEYILDDFEIFELKNLIEYRKNGFTKEKFIVFDKFDFNYYNDESAKIILPLLKNNTFNNYSSYNIEEKIKTNF